MDMEQNSGTMDMSFSQEQMDYQGQQIMNCPSSMPNPDTTVKEDYAHTGTDSVPPMEYAQMNPANYNESPESVNMVPPVEEPNSNVCDGVNSTVDAVDCSDMDFNFSIAINYIMSEMETSGFSLSEFIQESNEITDSAFNIQIAVNFVIAESELEDAVSNLCLNDYENSTIRKVLISTIISPDYLPVYTQFYGKNMFFILEFGYRVAETVMKLPVLNLADLIRAEFDIALFTDEARQSFLAFTEAEYAFLTGLNSATTPDETRMLLLRFLIDADASCVEEKCSTTNDLPQLIEFVVMINCLIHKTMVCTTQIKTYQLQNLLTAARIVYENLRVFVDFLGSCCSVVRHKMTKMHFI